MKKQKQTEYETSSGTKLTLKPIAYYTLRDVEKLLKRPEPPIYEFEGVGGAKAVRRHNETTLQTPEDLQAWESYQDALSEFHHRHACYTIGLGVVDDLEISQDWTDKALSLGGVIPSDKRELKGFYIIRELCPTPQEYNGLINSIMELSGLIVGSEVADKEGTF